MKFIATASVAILVAASAFADGPAPGTTDPIVTPPEEIDCRIPIMSSDGKRVLYWNTTINCQEVVRTGDEDLPKPPPGTPEQPPEQPECKRGGGCGEPEAPECKRGGGC